MSVKYTEGLFSTFSELCRTKTLSQNCQKNYHCNLFIKILLYYFVLDSDSYQHNL